VSGSAGPVGEIGAIPAGNQPIFEMKSAHGLGERTLVRIRQGASRLECYVKPDAQSANRFTAHVDADLQQPAGLGKFAPGATVELLNAEDWAVVAGINYYPGIRDLQGPVFDCATFKQWALDAGYVPDRQLISIAGSELRPTSTFEAHPKVEAITHAFETLIRAANKKRAHRLGRRLYLFFSGHGIIATRSITPDFRETALLAANADSLLLSRHVGLRSWAEWFRALGIFDEVFLVADCCREKEDLVPPTLPPTPPWTQEREEGQQFYVFSTKLAARAWEKELGKPPRVRGVLSYVMAEALKNRKLYNDQGLLTASSLMQHIYATVPLYTDKQVPIVDYPNNFNTEMIIAKWFPRVKQTVQIKFQPPIPGSTADIFAGNNLIEPLESHTVDDGQSWVYELDAGSLYKVAIRGTDRKVLFETTAIDEVQDVTV
jgi:hypothetical protein